MAATIDHSRDYAADPWFIREVQLSSIVAGQAENVAHGGPTGKKVSKFSWEVKTQPTALCSFTVIHEEDNDSTSNDTARIRVVAEDGGDLAGLVLKLHFHFKHFKTGGNS